MFASRSRFKCMVKNDDENEYIEVDDIPEEVFNNAAFYDYINGEFIFNEEKKEKINSLIRINNRIEELKKNLESTDYVIIKIAEGVATKEEYAEIIKLRSEWRNEINQLENNQS